VHVVIPKPLRTFGDMHYSGEHPDETGPLLYLFDSAAFVRRQVIPLSCKMLHATAPRFVLDQKNAVSI
jgi:hypothetical protein